MTRLSILLLLDLAMTGCNDSASNTTAADRDNTGVSVRDRDADEKTPIDQNENKLMSISLLRFASGSSPQRCR